jgi:endoglucanase
LNERAKYDGKKISRKEALGLAGGLAVAAMAGPGSKTVEAQTTSGLVHGIYNDAIFKACWNKTDMRPAIDATAAANGRKPTIVKFYGSWRNTYGLQGFPKMHLEAIRDKGCQPLFTWQPEHAYGTDAEKARFTPYQIARGSQDALIRDFANQAKAWGLPIWMRIFHEADLRNHGQYIWQTGSTTDVKNAYRRTVDIFRSVGAYNVKWVWTVASAKSLDRMRAVFPDTSTRSYHDYAGTDTYGNPEWQDGVWKAFYTIYRPQYDNIGALTQKPIIIGEFGQIEGKPLYKGEWIRKAHQEDIPYFPRIKAACYFDSWDWVLDSTASAREGYRRGIADSRWNGTL